MGNLRRTLFMEAVKLNLADDGDVIVKRKKMSAGKSVVEKHAEDVWLPTCAIRSSGKVPRMLLRNGKRGRVEFKMSQARQRLL